MHHSISASCDFGDTAAQKRPVSLMDDPTWGIRQPAKAPRADPTVTEARRLSAFAANRVDHLVDIAMKGDKPWSLKPRDPERLRSALVALHRMYERAAPDSTLGQESSNWKWWLKYCEEGEYVDVAPVRPDKRALTADEYILEQQFFAGAVPWIHTRMANKQGVVGMAKPSSVMAVLRGVRRAHFRMGIETAPLTAAVRACDGALREYVELHGPECLVPTRKEPLPPTLVRELVGQGTILVNGKLLTTKYHLEWDTPVFGSLRALFATLAQTGMRKAEVTVSKDGLFNASHISMASIRWVIGGIHYACPTAEQLGQLRNGDYALLTPPPSKSDQFSLHWGASTIYLRYMEDEKAHPICAARELAREELRRDVPADKRRSSPLFSPSRATTAIGKPWVSGQLATIFALMVQTVVGIEAAKVYTVHSFRIYLACALLEAGASAGTIQCMLRWRSDDALRIYARINDYKYADMLDKAAGSSISSIRTTTAATAAAEGSAALGADMRASSQGPTASPEAGYQSHWHARAAAIIDGTPTFERAAPNRVEVDCDGSVQSLSTSITSMLLQAERLDQEDAAGAWRF